MDAAKPKNNYKELKGEREFFRYLISDVITRFGDSLDSIAFSWITYSLTGSASLTAVTYGVNYLVTVLLQPFTGSFVTNLNHKAVLVITDIIRAAIVLSTAVLMARVSGLLGAISTSAIPIASFAVALSVSFIKIPVLIAVCGGLSILFMAITSRNKALKNI